MYAFDILAQSQSTNQNTIFLSSIWPDKIEIKHATSSKRVTGFAAPLHIFSSMEQFYLKQNT